MDVLLVEDHLEVRSALAELLEVEGFRVTAVGSAEEAVRAIEGGAFSLVICDHTLPGNSGAWLVDRLSPGGVAQVPVLMITAGPEAPAVAGVRVLLKPMDLDVFVAAVRSLTGAPAKVEGRQPPVAHRPSSPRAAAAALRLYVTSTTPASIRALRRLRELVDGYHEADLTLEVLDFAAGVPAQAEADRVLGTPSLLLQTHAGGRAWFVGDLDSADALRAMLEAAGVRRRGR